MKNLDIIWKVSISIAMLVMTISTVYYQHKATKENAFSHKDYQIILNDLEEIGKESKGL